MPDTIRLYRGVTRGRHVDVAQHVYLHRGCRDRQETVRFFDRLSDHWRCLILHRRCAAVWALAYHTEDGARARDDQGI